MGRSIPPDVKIAAACAALVLSFMIFEFSGGLFAAIYIGLCAYIIVQTFGNNSAG
jgi:hypothetical protein